MIYANAVINCSKADFLIIQLMLRVYMSKSSSWDDVIIFQTFKKCQFSLTGGARYDENYGIRRL